MNTQELQLIESRRASVSAGARYGRLVVERFLRVRRGLNLYSTLCDCGKTRVVDAWKLLHGEAISCGCLAREKNRARLTTHGRSRVSDPTYRSWYSMKSRCCNPTDRGYSDYGGRGIEVCGRWHRFENFLADMGERPAGTSLDRFPDNNGNYEPGNCRWATPVQQHRNTRYNVNLTIDGKTRCVAEWSQISGIGATCIHLRLKRGWEASRAVYQPSRCKNGRSKEANQATL